MDLWTVIIGHTGRMPRTPITRIRNAIGRFRALSEDVADLRDQVALLRDAIEGVERDSRILAVEASAVRDTVSHVARRSAFRRGRTTVVLLVHNYTVWSSLSEIYEVMREDEEFDPVVVSIPHDYDHSRGEQHGEADVHRFLNSWGVPHLRIPESELESAGEILRALDPDIVIRQSQWDSDIDEAFSTRALEWARLVYVPYEIANLVSNSEFHHDGRDLAVDSSLHRSAWLVFVANEHALGQAREASPLQGRRFRVVGHPKVDALRRVTPVWPVTRSEEADVPPVRILWSATHSFLSGWNDFGVFPDVKDDMLRWAEEDGSTDFVFIHHPHFLDAVQRPGSRVTPEEYRAWLNAWCSLPNASTFDGLYSEVLAACDVVVTDGLSMMVEPQVLSTPVVFLEREGHAGLTVVGKQFLRGVHVVDDVEGARQAVSGMLDAGRDELGDQQAANVRALLGAPGAARRIVEEIRSSIRAESPRGSGSTSDR